MRYMKNKRCLSYERSLEKNPGTYSAVTQNKDGRLICQMKWRKRKFHSCGGEEKEGEVVEENPVENHAKQNANVENLVKPNANVENRVKQKNAEDVAVNLNYTRLFFIHVKYYYLGYLFSVRIL